jgi:hypothetical protein
MKCIICGNSTIIVTTEKITETEMPVPIHKYCKEKAERNSRFGRMM